MDAKDPPDVGKPHEAATPRRRRRLSSWRLFMLIVAIVLLAMAAAGWIVGARRPAPHAVRAPAEPAVSSVAPQPAPRPAPTRTVKVDSVPPAETYPLADWTLEKAASGYLDTVTFSGAPLDPDTTVMLQDSDTVALSGWAGDTDLGMPFHRVLFSLCDRIVGGAPVGQPRPDVAQLVHPNLTNAGWTATLLVGHLPRCDGAKLAGWAVAPFGRILFPLLGEVAFPLAPARGIDPELGVETGTLLKPENADAPTGGVSVEIKGARANLRRCGDTTCKVVGALPRGKHTAIRLDARDGWTLLVVPGYGTGWVADTIAAVAPLAPSP